MIGSRRWTRCWPAPICWSSGRRIPRTATWPPTRRWLTSGGSPGGEPGYERRPVMKPGVSVVIPVYNEGEAIMPCLDRILQAVTLPCEVLVVYDMPDYTTVPYIEKAS